MHQFQIGPQSWKSFLYIKWREFFSEWIDNSFSNKCLLNIANYFISDSVSATRVYFSNLALSNRAAKIIPTYFVRSKFQNETYIFWESNKYETFMTNLSNVSQDEVSEKQVVRSRVAKTQQPDAERLKRSEFGYLNSLIPYVLYRFKCLCSNSNINIEQLLFYFV